MFQNQEANYASDGNKYSRMYTEVEVNVLCYKIFSQLKCARCKKRTGIRNPYYWSSERTKENSSRKILIGPIFIHRP